MSRSLVAYYVYTKMGYMSQIGARPTPIWKVSMVGPLASRASPPEPSLSYQLPGLGRKCIPRWYTNQPSPSKNGGNLHMVWGTSPKNLGKNGVFHVSSTNFRIPNWPWWWPPTCCTNVSIDPLVLPLAPSILAAWMVKEWLTEQVSWEDEFHVTSDIY